MQSDILFDNIYIGHSVDDAAKFQAETFDLKVKAEQAEKDATKPKDEPKPKSPLDLNFMDDPLRYVQDKFEVFMAIAKRDPMEAVKAVPEVAGAGVALFGILAATLFAIVGVNSAVAQDSAKKAKAKAKEAATTAKDKVAEAAATGSEKVQSEVQKRTTRSSAAAEQ